MGRLEGFQRGGESFAWLGEPLGQLGGQLPGAFERGLVLLRRRVGRIVEQQHHPQERILLQGRGEQRLADGRDLFAVGRDQHRHRRQGRVEGIVDDGARHPAVRPGPIQRALPRHQVQQRRQRQE